MHSIDQFDLILRTWAGSLGFTMESILRLVLAVVAGGLIGMEREIRGRQAGFRTNILVCLGSALAMIVSAYVPAMDYRPGLNMHIQSDPARIAYGVMGGIGFIGAGAIIHMGSSIRGLTTAAGLWCVAAMGLAAGLGLYLLVILTTLIVLAVLWLFDDVQRLFPRSQRRRIVVRRAWTEGCVADTADQFGKWGFRVVDLEYQRTHDLQNVDLTLEVEFSTHDRFSHVQTKIAGDCAYTLLSDKDY